VATMRRGDSEPDVRPLCEVWWEGTWKIRKAVSEDVSLAGLPSGGPQRRISNQPVCRNYASARRGIR
jgi:hypothetical protein